MTASTRRPSAWRGTDRPKRRACFSLTQTIRASRREAVRVATETRPDSGNRYDSERTRQGLQTVPDGADHGVDRNAQCAGYVEESRQRRRIEQQLEHAAQAVQHDAAPQPAP